MEAVCIDCGEAYEVPEAYCRCSTCRKSKKSKERVSYESWLENSENERLARLRDFFSGMSFDDMAAKYNRTPTALKRYFSRHGYKRFEKTTPTYIYGLKCPIDEKIRWVGKTDNPTQRLQRHMCQPTNSLMEEWIDKLRSLGLKPKMVILATVQHKYWRQSELAIMKKYAKHGHNLLNLEVAGWSGELPRWKQERLNRLPR